MHCLKAESSRDSPPLGAPRPLKAAAVGGAAELPAERAGLADLAATEGALVAAAVCETHGLGREVQVLHSWLSRR